MCSIKMRKQKTLSSCEWTQQARDILSSPTLAVRGMDWFLQVKTVMWGGGKTSSTHPYNVGESETRQLVQSLSEVPGKPRALAVPWDQSMSPKAKEQVEMPNTACRDGLLWTAWLPSLPYAKIQTTLHPKCVWTLTVKCAPTPRPCRTFHLSIQLLGGGPAVLCGLCLLLIWSYMYCYKNWEGFQKA